MRGPRFRNNFRTAHSQKGQRSGAPLNCPLQHRAGSRYEAPMKRSSPPTTTQVAQLPPKPVPAPMPAARAAATALGEALATIVREAVFDAFAELMDGELARPTATKGLVDRAAIAEQLGVCTATIANLERRGLPRVMVGDSVRYDSADVLSWLKAGGPEQQGTP